MYSLNIVYITDSLVNHLFPNKNCVVHHTCICCSSVSNLFALENVFGPNARVRNANQSEMENL